LIPSVPTILTSVRTPNPPPLRLVLPLSHTLSRVSTSAVRYPALAWLPQPYAVSQLVELVRSGGVNVNSPFVELYASAAVPTAVVVTLGC